jgi:hypothetical protein
MWHDRHDFHHGMTGLAIACAAAAYLELSDVSWMAVAALGAGAALMWHDRHDFPWTADRDAMRAIGPRPRR